VCASIPGNAEKKKPIMGSKKNSSGCMMYENGLPLFGLGGRLTASMMKIITIETSDSVNNVEVT